MGWNFRRRIGIGPFRFNLSKSGVGLSAGVRGFRIGKDAKGRLYSQTSIPGTGIYRRDYYPQQAPVQQPAPNPSSASPGRRTYMIALGVIAVLLWFLLVLMKTN